MVKILCVEDEAGIREEIAEELECEGYDVYVAENGKEGLASILENKPDLVICDINMPVMNGYDLLKELRASHPNFADTPFIYLSAFADRKDVIAGLDLGADDYLTKPIDFEMLLTKVKSTLRQVSRMEEKKKSEHVKLYKTLTSGSDHGEDDPPVEASDPGLMIVLVGKEDDGISAIQKTLVSQGHTVKRITSGKNFIDRVEKLAPDLVLIGFYTSDMQANMTAKFARQRCAENPPYVLLWQDELTDTPKDEAAREFDDILILPCAEADLKANIAKWTGDE